MLEDWCFLLFPLNELRPSKMLKTNVQYLKRKWNRTRPIVSIFYLCFISVCVSILHCAFHLGELHYNNSIVGIKLRAVHIRFGNWNVIQHCKIINNFTYRQIPDFYTNSLWNCSLSDYIFLTMRLNRIHFDCKIN